MAREDIKISCETENDSGVINVRSLAGYIANYIEEEMIRSTDTINGETILNAIEAYQGGAR